MLRLAVTSLMLASVVGTAGCFGNGGGSEVKAQTGEFASDRGSDSGRGTFASNRGDGGGETPVAFDGPRAMGYLEDVCKIGPRISGSDGMKKQQELLQKHFEALGGKVTYQRFQARQRSQHDPVEMANMIVSWYPERQRRVILCSHYDTRPIADQERDPRSWRREFLSANDGGSGVALLMELAHHMKDLKTQVGVDFVFFDGEEYIFDRDLDKYFFGSEYFAEDYQKKAKGKPVYLGALLFDMIAGPNPSFPQEPYSRAYAEALVDEIWQIAAEQKCSAFKNRGGQHVQDDHLALNSRGRIPAVDIIDFDYKHWHKLTDIPANCAKDGMEQVARVVSVWLQRVK
jgi:hypothetical protein